MNTKEKIIVGILGALLVGWMFFQNKEAKKRAEWFRENGTTNIVAEAGVPEIVSGSESTQQAESAVIENAPAETADVVKNAEPDSGKEETVSELTGELVSLEITSKGGSIKSAKLLKYPRTNKSDDSDPVVLDFSDCPALSIENLPGFGVKADYDVVVTPENGTALITAHRADGLELERFISVTNGYRLLITDRFRNNGNGAIGVPESAVSLGVMRKVGDIDASMLAVDYRDDGSGKAAYPEYSAKMLAPLFGGKAGGGCSAGSIPEGAPLSATTNYSGNIKWIASRSQFFVQVLTPAEASGSVGIKAIREAGKAMSAKEVFATASVPEMLLAPGGEKTVSYDYYVGPRKMSYLRALGGGQKMLMRFGFWRVFCEWFLDLLNLLHKIIPNYGVSIILLTLLVRLAMLPVTKRGAESMKRMSAMQPKLKEVQALYKDDPQKLQQEQMRLYAEYKVNPLSSCLPMLIQLPVFIALFVVLQRAVELRFATFLWVRDLSAPENLLEGMIPVIGSINLLPIAMAGTTYLQSKLTPVAGDASQQRMMMVFMPLMMLFMFYKFPSALGLYWTTSSLLGICGLLWQRRKAKDAEKVSGGVEVIPPPKKTRQMRRAEDRRV